ncbi:MAG: type II toxin-antitoxin system ParD family antitoxin [Zetaproteobacteria bacterium CG_4_9_14_3_um_filter_49_83]|nr:MAG: CopG family transcriptional regulator [Zetaproteobacteria bacterium CG1_02_49_23]PIQ34035.1 MAG: type II toxin-antitoxin system ParD family antitoxin [Zetaproteobacteria bacterium CG17_big_fil_post_rev_8_21_14_2_50_50_13]PIV29482.1 MAG: type II toxin-antitoxin system ParD family antitoxin [Zetaproteobacteria bacterium CG02_land_8_20_14_3_00_50_9]PIY55917.1 MAG: type II toxin-antitoxin system ParD family antitoxin [Zetaproteobacteria bacterium CG_4_10_14_0_8_um_filter_49_80]PJA35047.1 MA
MNFSLTPSLEQFIRDRAATGDYNNASEVVREALRLLKRTEEQRALKLERLRTAVRAGDEAIANGDFIDVNGDEELDAFFGRL